MSRSRLFDALRRTIALARHADRRGLSTDDAQAEARAELERTAQARDVSRRGFLGGMAALGAAVAVGLPRGARAATTTDVAIVGAGLAGLGCADRLLRAGIQARLYEAQDRVGGRCWSLRGFFPGQVAERGGELVDNLHKTMIAYAKEFGLTLEDMGKVPGEVFYHFDGRRVPEAQVVDEFRAFVASMQADLRACSGSPTAIVSTEADRALDNLSLAEYLTSRGAGPIVYQAIEQAYKAEYGLELDEQSALNFLLFIHADKRSKFTPFGVFSDERYHIVEGNDAIATGIAGKLAPGQLQLGQQLVRVAKSAAGRIELTFKQGSKTVVRTHDAVVLTLPFSVLRNVELAASLALPAWKRDAIAQLGYGMNAKTMVGFDGPCWAELGGNGASYSDLANHQTTWETNPTRATAQAAILTDYASGDRAVGLRTDRVQSQVDLFVKDLDQVFPGAAARATRTRSGYRAHLEHWPSNPYTQGSYTCYRPGQFTTVAGNEGRPIGNLFFGGEHTNSFYEWQGFMEGALLSGLAAADGILKG